MPQIDLAFRLTGTQPLPADHGYTLYGAISGLLPEAHRENGIAIHPIRGRIVGHRQMMLTEFSRLTLRVPDDRIADFLSLAGKPLRIGETSLRVGVPEVRPLHPAPALRSRLVTIKLKVVSEMPKDRDEESRRLFKDSVRRKLDALGVSSEVKITIGKRHALQIKHKEVVGYEVIVNGLDALESVTIQENGPPDNPHIGFARQHMGCGVFVSVSGRGKSE